MMRGTPLGKLLQGHNMSRTDATPIMKGIKGHKYPTGKEGYRIATPEELASLLVPVQEVVDGQIIGFQRPLNVTKARKIAEAIKAGEPMPAIEIALHKNAAWANDGQHRAAGAIIARAELPTLARHLDEDEMKALFAGQAKRSTVNPSILVLSATDPFSEYVQDAVTSPNGAHPWSWLVTSATSSKTRLTPNQMRLMVAAYVTGTMSAGGGGAAMEVLKKPFDRNLADTAATIIGAFGGKEANPAAYRVHTLRASIYAAIIIVRRHHQDEAAAITRWKNHMPKFRFDRYMMSNAEELTPVLINHWNKGLADNKRVPLVSNGS